MVDNLLVFVASMYWKTEIFGVVWGLGRSGGEGCFEWVLCLGGVFLVYYSMGMGFCGDGMDGGGLVG